MATVVMIGEAFFLFLISPHCRDCFNSVRNNNTNATVPYISRCFARPLPLLLFPSPHLMVVSIASTVPSPRCVLSFPSWCSAFYPFLFSLPVPMSRLRTGRLPQLDPHPVVARLKTQPASRLTFQPRVSTRANPGPTARSFLAPRPTRDSIRSFESSRLGSRLPVRSPSPTQPPSFERPTQLPSFRRHAIVEERRLTRQNRPRPWATERSTQPSRLHLSSRNPTPLTIPTIPTNKKLSARVGNVRAKPETSVNGGRKNKPAKRVHFGETTVIPVTRWIDQVLDVYLPPEIRRMKILQAKEDALTAQEKYLAAKRAAGRTTRQVDNARAKPSAPAKSERKSKPTKSVRFGETTVVSVPRWIDRRKHIYPGPIAAMGTLQGWSVTPLTKPDEDGEEEKYTTYWGSDSYAGIFDHISQPCNRQDCAWKALARLQARHPDWTPPEVFRCWLRKRESVRKKGVFML